MFVNDHGHHVERTLLGFFGRYPLVAPQFYGFGTAPKPNRKRNSQNSTDTSANIDRDHACRTGAVAAATKPANCVPNHKEDAQSAT
jgi:hypothetical protein